MIETQIESLPRELKEGKQCTFWKRLKKPDGEITKPPCNKDGYNHDCTLSKNLLVFDQALKTFLEVKEKGKIDGIGFAFNETGISGIDIDHCIDEAGNLSKEAREIVDRVDSYTEVSPSGTGIHIFVKGTIPEKYRNPPTDGQKKNGETKGYLGSKRGDFEAYSSGRYFTLTGNAFKNIRKIEERQAELTWFFETFIKPETKPEQEPKDYNHGKRGDKEPVKANQAGEKPQTAQEVIKLIENCRNSEKFRSLMDGTDGGEDRSKADLSLLTMLAFYCGEDPALMESVFNQSKLADRDKWKREDYRTRTIAKAIKDNGGKVFKPKAVTSSPVVKNQSNIGHRNLTDMGNGERLVDHSGNDLKYCHPWRVWLVWDDKRWKIDDTASVQRMAKETVREIYQEAINEPNEIIRKEIAKHAARSEGDVKINAMINQGMSELSIPVLPQELDKNKWLLCVENGVVDLKTGNLNAHDRKDLITKMAPVMYQAGAKCPTWERFLSEIMDGNQNLVQFLKRSMGYCLTADTSEHAFFICHGSGRNGKSVFLETIAFLMGDYAKEAKVETLMLSSRDESGGSANEDVAILAGARMVSANETKSGQRLDEKKIKALTGGDRIRARRLYQGSFEFIPEFKLWLRTNHKPVIRDTDIGIWDRIMMIPFAVYFQPEKRDKKLSEKLKGELSGILNWAVEGCLEWQRDGLKPPVEVIAATNQYKESQDVLAAFIAEKCYLPKQNPWAVKTTASNLYLSYVQWCKESGERTKAQRVFGEALTERGLKKGRNGVGAVVWEGIGLLTSSEGSEGSEPIPETFLYKNSTRELPENGSEGSDPSDEGGSV